MKENNGPTVNEAGSLHAAIMLTRASSFDLSRERAVCVCVHLIPQNPVEGHIILLTDHTLKKITQDDCVGEMFSHCVQS